MPAPEEQDAWERLGALLERRRVEMDTRYRNLTLFCEERDIDYRLAWDIEHAARDNYRRPTITAIEIAYAWVPGSIRRVLAGGEPATSGFTPRQQRILREFPQAVAHSDGDVAEGGGRPQPA
jgi:hypothetical protein